ncbi:MULTISPECIES: SHOCT domain-containing protein [Neobacillus]|uniref:SHOCT domain-containing protein n=1 Tax=Neobacillus rhizophilus TaxID=2833579 RepID=A0A942U7Z8_9BACI|nr:MULTISPECIES: SHOCT domain-containing protein [Neobacillus]MBS4213963.1 SHOCT domain-containing protein [Neobacillus rhizophilus]MBU8917632.1 SHOCT domain-containing protein [Bacillus sp. FJAT-29953]
MHWGYFHPFGFIFFLLLLGLIFANFRLWRGKRGFCYQDRHHHDPLLILDKRLASGEITIEEYTKLKDFLSGKQK